MTNPTRRLRATIRTTMLGLAIATGSGCESTHVTPVTSAQFAPDEDERQIWNEAQVWDTALQQRGLVYYDSSLDTYLRSVADRLRPALHLGDANIRFHVLNDPFLNAFALPNGTVYLHSGLLSRMDNEAQLASVVGHELAHFSRRHALISQRADSNRRAVASTFIGILAVAAVAASGNANAARVFADLGDSVAQPLLDAQVNGYSRDLEREADELGFAALVAGGYDPREAPKVFQALQLDAKEAGIEEPYFFGSHPRLEERIASYDEALASWQPPANVEPRVETAVFNQAITKVRMQNVRADLALGRYQRARANAERQLAHDPGNAEAQLLVGEALRRGAPDR